MLGKWWMQDGKGRRRPLAAGIVAILAGLALVGGPGLRAQAAKTPQLVWIDTDIGDDIDDAFALALVLRSPELKVLGISTAFGDTETRARLVDRYLAALGQSSIPVSAGIHTETSNPLTQRAYAEQSPARQHPDGVAAMLAAIHAHPGQVTLIAIGPLFNVGAAIERDARTFREVKRVVIMGGSVYRGYDGRNGERRPPDAEWNILEDPKGAQKLFTAGVPLFVMPLDSTQIHLEAAARDELFAKGGKLGEQLRELYTEWAAGNPGHAANPTLFDPVAAAYTFRPGLCPAKPMHIEVDGKGMTRPAAGAPNAQVCLHSDEAGFLRLLQMRLEQPTP